MDSQKGVSLIITFFVMTVVVAVVLSVSSLLYGEIKIIRNVSNSVISFYAADSGIEKVLYYDRKEKPEGAIRGLCNICDVCPDCHDCILTQGGEGGCDPETCTDCNIVFSSQMSAGKTYNLNADIFLTTGAQCGISQADVKSYGSYENTSRAINLDMSQDTGTIFGPGISDNGTWVTGGQVIHFRVNAPPPPDVPSILAYVFYSATENGPYTLLNDPGNPASLSYISGQGEWQGNYNTGITGYFSIGISATDSNDVCASITITPE